MTRFARAKGSKASNLKAPEDSTPWEVMKEQMLKAKKDNEECKKFKEAEQQRINNYENFLKERRVEKRKAEWCDFPETQSKKSTYKSNQNLNEGNKNNKYAQSKANIELESKSEPNESNNVIKIKKKNKKNKLKHNLENGETNNLNSKPVSQDSQNKSNGDKEDVSDKPYGQNLPHVDKKIPGDNKKRNNKNKEDLKISMQAPQNVQSNENMKKKKKKMKDTPVRRKEINDRSFKLIINGKDIELVRFDGFPIMKRDAERLQELRNSMIKKGIPKSEVQRTLKLERRRAEKALARLKRDVCYNCRKGGHNLSDCPDLKSNIPGVGTADGMCFKCGSTEHRQNECKVQKDKEFRFATCFICREPGHLARQCPDNPKGLYPNGGCCKLCGDVTHLRKDCPTVSEKKEGTSIKLPTLDTLENIEDIGQSTKPLTIEEPVKKPKKIKF